MKNEEINKELQDLSETLAAVPKIEKDRAPDGYFEDLPDTTWKRITTEQSTLRKEKSKVISIASKMIGVAASIVLLFFVINGIDLEGSEDEIPVDTMVEYIIDDLGELDEEFLYELHIESEDMVDIDDEALDYILEEGMDLIDDKLLETLY